MPPQPVSSSRDSGKAASSDTDGGSSVIDWKVLIDNGLVGGGDGGGGPNQTAVHTEEPPAQPPLPRAPANGANNLIPLYCGLLGALICGLVLWIVLKHARSRGRNSKLTNSHSPNAGDVAAPLTVAAAPDCEDNDLPDDSLPLADLTELQLKRLRLALDCRSGWKALAAEMGYDADTISELESSARSDSASPAGLLLRRYCEAADADAASAATVGDLRRLLAAAGQSDALQRQRGSQTAGADRQKRRRHRQQSGGSASGVKPEAVELTTV